MSAPAFLLATNKRDITTDFIVAELKKRSLPFIRINTEDLARAKVTFRPRKGQGWRLEFDDHIVDLEQVRAAYYRRPGVPLPPPDAVEDRVQSYCVEEWSAVLRSLWNALEGRWLNSPFAILRAEDKPRQLSEAAELGFLLPETLVTNDFDAASLFVAQGNVIGKPLRRALVDHGDTQAVLFTSRLGQIEVEDRRAVTLAPVIYQREISKACDVRVTVVGDRLFAVAIHSQAVEETSVDWRKGSRPELVHEVICLPESVKAGCLELTRRLGLSYGAIDLVLDKEGQFWFLEINPNGQWAWIERRTDAPIAAAIVDSLVEIAA